MRKIFPLIINIFIIASYVQAAELELNSKLIITPEEKDFFCKHLRIVVDKCDTYIGDKSIAAENPVYKMLKQLDLDLKHHSNDCEKLLIASPLLQTNLLYYIDNEALNNPVNKALREQIEKRKADWQAAEKTLKNNLFVGSCILFKVFYPKFSSPAIGVGAERGLEFMQDNKDFQADENFFDLYRAAFIYRFIYGRRTPESTQ